MAFRWHNLHRNCELSAVNFISDLSDCDSSDSDSLPFLHANPPNLVPSSRPPNFTKSMIRKHFGVPEKREMVASTPVYRIRKRKSDTPSEKSISLSPIEKQNSVQACHIISAKKPDCQRQLQFVKTSNDFDSPLVQTKKIQENGKATPPAEDLEVITKKKRFSLRNVKNEHEKSVVQENQKNEKTVEVTKEIGKVMTPVVKLVKLRSNVCNPTVNKSIQLSCKKKRKKNSEEVQSGKEEDCYDLINNEALVEDRKKLSKETIRSKSPEINIEVQKENDVSREETNTKRQTTISENFKNHVENKQDSADIEAINSHDFAEEATITENYFEEHEQSIEVIDLTKNENKNEINFTVNKRSSNILIDSNNLKPLFDQVDKVVEEFLGGNNKITRESVQQTINIKESLSKRNNDAEKKSNVRKEIDVSVNKEIPHIQSENNLTNSSIEDPLLDMCDNDKADLNDEYKNMKSPKSTRSNKHGDVKKIGKSVRRKLDVTETEHGNKISVLKTSKKKSIEKLDNKIEQVEKIHETRTSIRRSKTSDINATIKKRSLHNKKSFSQKLPEVRKSRSKDIQNELQKMNEQIVKTKKERNKKDEKNLKNKELEENNEKTKRSTSTSHVKNKYTQMLSEFMKQRENGLQYYSNTSSISTINEDQTTSARRSTRTRKQTKTLNLETIIVTEREFLSYCGMRINSSKKSTHILKPEFKVPAVPSSTSKKKSKKKNSENITRSNLPDSGNYSASSRLLRSTADNNVDVLPENVHTSLELENDIILPPIIEENNDSIQKPISRMHYNLRNKSSLQCHSKNSSQSEKCEDNEEQNTNHKNHNKTKNDNNKTQDSANKGKKKVQEVNEFPQEVKSSRNTKKRQLDNVEESHKDVDHESKHENSKIKILRATKREETTDNKVLRKTECGTTNVSSDTMETNQSFTMPTTENHYELNDVCYVVNNCAEKATWCHKKPELIPVKGQQGIYLGYSISNQNLGFCTYSAGLMKIEPKCLKKQCYFKTSHAYYLVVEGEAEATLGPRKMHVHVGESFFIPLGQDYSIKNPSNTEKLLLSFTNVKAPKFIT